MKEKIPGPLLPIEYILKLLLQAARRTWNCEISPREFAMVCLTVRICLTSCLVATVAPATSTVLTALCASLHTSAATETLTVQTAAMRRLAVSCYLPFYGVIQLIGSSPILAFYLQIIFNNLITYKTFSKMFRL